MRKNSSNDLWRWWENERRPVRRLEKDETLFHRNETVSAVYRVEEGSVRLERRTIDGRLLILRTFRTGELCAEASPFASAYHCDASAAEPSTVSICTKPAFVAAISRNPAMAIAFAQLVSRELHSLRQQLELRNVRSARERVLLFLELHADVTSRAFELNKPLQEIAAELGLTREAFYRTLAMLERQGLIKRRQDSIALRRSRP